MELSNYEIKKLNSKLGLSLLLSEKEINLKKIVRFLNYQSKLKKTSNRINKTPKICNEQ